MKALKSRLVGTALGRALLELARRNSLRGLSLRNPEAASSTANAILADRLIARLTPPGGSFLDIGAHIGSVFSSVHQTNPSAQIFAVEADPAKARALQTRFPYCTLFPVALGEGEGEIAFYRHPTLAGYNSLAKSDKPGVQKIMVPIARLDDLLPEQNIDVMKIDIEGAELGPCGVPKPCLRGPDLS